MKIDDFIMGLKEEFEIDESVEFNLNTDLNALKGFDSMSALIIISYVDEHIGIKLSADQLKSLTTVQSLIEIIGKDKFE